MKNEKFGITYKLRKHTDNPPELVIPDKYSLLSPDVIKLIEEVQTSITPKTTSVIPVTALQIIISMHNPKKATHIIPLCTPYGLNCHDKYIVRGNSVYYYLQGDEECPVVADVVKLSTIQKYMGIASVQDLQNMTRIRREVRENIVRKLMFHMITNKNMPATLYKNTTDFLRDVNLQDLHTAIKNCFGEETYNLYVNSFKPAFSYGVIIDTLDTQTNM